MLFDRLRRSGAVAGLVAAAALAAPAGVSASVTGQPTAITVSPDAVNRTSASAPAAEGIQVAQNRVVRQNRKTRAVTRRQNQRTRELVRRRAGRDVVRRGGRDRIVRRGGRGRIYRNNRWYYYRNDGRYYDDAGGLLAGLVIGGAAGAIAGSLATRDRTVVVQDRGFGASAYSSDWYRLCDRKYNSFRASDGTYLGYDGFRHTCRLP